MLRGARFDSSTVFSLPSLWSAGAAFWQRAFASDFAWKVGETFATRVRSEEHTSELQSPWNPVCRLLLEKKANLGATGFVPTAGRPHAAIVRRVEHPTMVVQTPASVTVANIQQVNRVARSAGSVRYPRPN